MIDLILQLNYDFFFFYVWELFCQYLMPVSVSEVELNRLLTPDSVHMSWFLLNWMCQTNPFKILVLYLFFFRKPRLDKDVWWLWTMNFSSNGEITSVLCLTDQLPSMSFHIDLLLFCCCCTPNWIMHPPTCAFWLLYCRHLKWEETQGTFNTKHFLPLVGPL